MLSHLFGCLQTKIAGILFPRFFCQNYVSASGDDLERRVLTLLGFFSWGFCIRGRAGFGELRTANAGVQGFWEKASHLPNGRFAFDD